jgi:hypothetical protein
MEAATLKTQASEWSGLQDQKEREGDLSQLPISSSVLGLGPKYQKYFN